MTQPFVATDAVHAGETGVQHGAYAPRIVKYLANVTGTDDINVVIIPADTWVTRVWGRIVEELDGSGTLDFGYADSEDAFLDAADWTETTAEQFATNVGSSNASKPAGVYFTTATQLYFTVGGSPTKGQVEVVIETLEVANMDEVGTVTN